MSLEQIVVLAFIQGITEFLPISSSGHLILVPALTGWADQGVVTDMVTNLGTLAAVIIYFWRDVVHMFWGAIDLVRRRASHNADLVFHIFIGTIPIIVVGLLLKLVIHAIRGSYPSTVFQTRVDRSRSGAELRRCAICPSDNSDTQAA